MYSNKFRVFGLSIYALINFILLISLIITLSPKLCNSIELIKQPLIKKNTYALRESIDRAIAIVKPALVMIHVVGVEYEEGREIKYESVGSGVIITKEGHVVTNHHVAGKAIHIICTLSNREEIEADLIGTDPLSDISIIKLRTKGPRRFPIAKFGDSSSVKVGDYVLAMGSPFALSQSVTMGIISNTELVIPDLFWPFNKFTIDGENVGSIVKWIGHDAAIYGGNSGGPLVNLKGEVIGINEASMGLSCAIPSNLAKEVTSELIKYGKVRRSWIGLEVQPLLKSSGIKRGALVSGTIEGSPAEKGGFLPGDILLSLANHKVNIRFLEGLPTFNHMVTRLPIGKEVDALVLRKDKKIFLHIVPEEREDILPKPKELREWGITACNLSMLIAKEMKRKDKHGVLVLNVRPGGPCGEAKPSILKNDVIIEVNRKTVKNLNDILNITNKILEGKDSPVPVLVAFERDNRRYITVVNLGIKHIEDSGIEVRKAWLPVSVQALTPEIAKAMGIGIHTGVRVTYVFPNSTAEKAGLKEGDLIVKLNGESIPISQPEDIELFPAMVHQYRIGSKVELTVIRGEKEFKIPVKLVPSPISPREMRRYRDDNFEFSVREIGHMDRVREKWEEEQNGVLVEAVDEGGWAALGHLAVDDLIISVDGNPIKDVASIERIMKKIAVKKPKQLVFQVKRGIHNIYIELEPNWNKDRK